MPTILVVDDEYEISAAVRSVLEDEGYEVDVCYDGQQALERLDAGAVPDLVLSDIMMPHLDGLELLDRVRHSDDEALERVPFVLMSAINPRSLRAEADWDDFLKKPFDVERLLAIARRYAGPR